MSDNPVMCPRCGRPHGRCKAHNRAGGPCGQWPLAGQEVCRLHGGAKPAAIANGERRQADAKAEGVVRRLLLDPQSQPVTDPVLSLQRLAGGLEGMVAELSSRVGTLPVGVDDGPQLRAEVLLLERLIGHLRTLLVDMARLGLEDRVTAVMEAQGEQVFELVQAIGRGLLVELAQLLASQPAALGVLEDDWQRLFERVAYEQLGARHELEAGRAS